jgi:ABC-type transport system involved in multi-copper enzyme maturation permease subunit
MNNIRSWVEINPIIVKELRSRMRGGRAFLTLTLILLVTGAGLIGMISLLSNFPSYYGRAMLSAQVGNILFGMLVSLELLIVCTVTPAITAGSLSGEIEKLTFDLLLATSLSPARILWGKLVSALSYIGLLLFAAIPLASIVFVFGGITLSSMAKVLVMLALSAVMVGTMGLFFSALLRRTGRATVISLLVVVFLMLAPIFIAVVMMMVGQEDLSRWLIGLSPISAVTSAMLPPTIQQMDSNPISSLIFGGLLNRTLVPVSNSFLPRPVYHYSLVLFSTLSVLFYFGAMSLIDPTRRWRLTRKQILAGAVILIAIAGASIGGYLATADHYEWYRPPEGTIDPVIAQPAITQFNNGVDVQQVVSPENEMAPAAPEPTPTAMPAPDTTQAQPAR